MCRNSAEINFPKNLTKKQRISSESPLISVNTTSDKRAAIYFNAKSTSQKFPTPQHSLSWNLMKQMNTMKTVMSSHLITMFMPTKRSLHAFKTEIFLQSNLTYSTSSHDHADIIKPKPDFSSKKILMLQSEVLSNKDRRNGEANVFAIEKPPVTSAPSQIASPLKSTKAPQQGDSVQYTAYTASFSTSTYIHNKIKFIGHPLASCSTVKLFGRSQSYNTPIEIQNSIPTVFGRSESSNNFLQILYSIPTLFGRSEPSNYLLQIQHFIPTLLQRFESSKHFLQILHSILTLFERSESSNNSLKILCSIPTLFGRSESSNNSLHIQQSIPKSFGRSESSNYILLLQKNQQTNTLVPPVITYITFSSYSTTISNSPQLCNFRNHNPFNQSISAILRSLSLFRKYGFCHPLQPCNHQPHKAIIIFDFSQPSSATLRSSPTMGSQFQNHYLDIVLDIKRFLNLQLSSAFVLSSYPICSR